MSNRPPIRVFSVDDHPLLREGIAALINNQPDMKLVAEASNGAEAIQVFKQQVPDVTLLDLRLPDMSGIDISDRDSQRVSRGADHHAHDIRG